MDISNKYEIIALKKLLDYIKFSDRSDEDRLKEFVSSPFISSVLEKVNHESSEIYKQYDLDNEVNSEADFLSIPSREDSIINNVKLYEEWKEYDNELKENIIKSLVSPYKCSKEYLIELRKKVDN